MLRLFLLAGLGATAPVLGPIERAAAGRPAAPRFTPELKPLLGTWRHVRETKGKTISLWLVIKEQDGVLRIRYQLPARDKIYTSDWDGQIEVDIQVNITEKRKTSYEVQQEPPAILVHEQIGYSGSDQRHAVAIESVYELGAPGKLLFRCRSLRRGKKELSCPGPLEYQRVSDETRWPG